MKTVADYLKQLPSVKRIVELAETTYMGPCVVQSPGAWTRVGPTWHHPTFGWITVGPGTKRWGTTEGLAELATQVTANPGWHAEGVAVSPAPNLVFAITEDALTSEHMARVKELCI